MLAVQDQVWNRVSANREKGKDKLLQAEKDVAAAEAERLKKKCEKAEKAIEKAKAKRMAEFEAYALGKKKSYDASIDEVDVKVKCIEQGKTQARLAEEIDTTKTYVNRVIKKNESVVNNTFVKMIMMIFSGKKIDEDGKKNEYQEKTYRGESDIY